MFTHMSLGLLTSSNKEYFSSQVRNILGRIVVLDAAHFYSCNRAATRTNLSRGRRCQVMVKCGAAQRGVIASRRYTLRSNVPAEDMCIN